MARALRRRVAAWRSIRLPVRLRRIGPPVRLAHGEVDGPGDGGWEGDVDDLVALAVHVQDPVAVDLGQVGDVGAGGLEDPQPEQAEHRDQGEVVGVGRLPGRGEHGLELQMGQPEGG